MSIIDEWSQEEPQGTRRGGPGEYHVPYHPGSRGPSEGTVMTTQAIAEELGISRQGVDHCLRVALYKVRRAFQGRGYTHAYLDSMDARVEHRISLPDGVSEAVFE